MSCTSSQRLLRGMYSPYSLQRLATNLQNYEYFLSTSTTQASCVIRHILGDPRASVPPLTSKLWCVLRCRCPFTFNSEVWFFRQFEHPDQGVEESCVTQSSILYAFRIYWSIVHTVPSKRRFFSCLSGILLNNTCECIVSKQFSSRRPVSIIYKFIWANYEVRRTLIQADLCGSLEWL